MANLSETILNLNEPPVMWIKGTVISVNTQGFLTLEYMGGHIPNVAYSDQYTPVAGDIVHVLMSETMGMLVLCSSNTPAGAGPAEPIDQTPVLFNPTGSFTYGPDVGTWQSGLFQAEGQIAGWLYNSALFAAIRGTYIQQAEIEITAVSGGPAELIPHTSTAATGTLVTTDDLPWVLDDLPVGVPTWVDIPIDWADGLLNGDIAGIGITSSGQTGEYSGTGRVRLTPLSVTI